MRRDPRVTLLCYDPRRPLRYLEVRGTVIEMTEDGASQHLDALASKYAGRTIELLRRRHPGAIRRDRDPGPLPHPPGPRRGRRRAPDPQAGHDHRSSRPRRSPVPASHLDLLTRPICGVLTTMGDGQPQSSLVWVDFDGECARVNTTLQRQKGRNMVADPKVSLLIVDPEDTGRFVQIRGDAELVTDGAIEHLDALTTGVHQPSALLRLHLSGRAAGARDARHLPDPRPAHHAWTRSTPDAERGHPWGVSVELEGGLP